MVKHQRRSHQPGGILEDGTDEDEDDSPLTPRGPQQPYWVAQGMMPNGMVQMSRVPSSQPYIHPSFGQHRTSLASNVGPEYTHNMQHHDAHETMRRVSQQSQMYVSEGPGVATMHSYAVPRHHSISFNEPGLAPSMQSSPSGSSMESVRSPGAEYTFQAQAATHALQNAESQPQNMGHFHPAVSQPMLSSQSMMAMAQHQQQQTPVTHDVYHTQHATTGPTPTHVPFENGLAAYQQHPLAYQNSWVMPVTSEYKVDETHHLMLPAQRLESM